MRISTEAITALLMTEAGHQHSKPKQDANRPECKSDNDQEAPQKLSERSQCSPKRRAEINAEYIHRAPQSLPPFHPSRNFGVTMHHERQPDNDPTDQQDSIYVSSHGT